MVSAMAAASKLWVAINMVVPVSEAMRRNSSKNQVAGGGVEVARGLIGKQQARRVHQRTCYRDALHLASRKLERLARSVVRHVDPPQGFERQRPRIRPPGKHQRQLHIFDDGESRQ